MSNCIEFKNGSNVVRFTDQEFDISRFMMDLVNAKSEYMADKEKAMSPENIWYWFIFDIVDLIDVSLIHTPFPRLEIVFRLGEGNSTHTWRDFKWMLEHLSKYVLKTKEVTFYIADEFDNFETVSEETVEFFRDGHAFKHPAKKANSI